MTKPRSNNDNPLTPESLIKILKEYKKQNISHFLRTPSKYPQYL